MPVREIEVKMVVRLGNDPAEGMAPPQASKDRKEWLPFAVTAFGTVMEDIWKRLTGRA